MNIWLMQRIDTPTLCPSAAKPIWDPLPKPVGVCRIGGDSGVYPVLLRATKRTEVERIGTKSDYYETGSVIEGRRDCPRFRDLEQPPRWHS